MKKILLDVTDLEEWRKVAASNRKWLVLSPELGMPQWSVLLEEMREGINGRDIEREDDIFEKARDGAIRAWDKLKEEK